MYRPFLAPILAAAAMAALAACTDDPFDRPGTVAPRGFNEANLRAMVVEPAHLSRGVDATTTRGDAGSKPVDLLRSGKRAPLPASAPATPFISINGGSGNGGR
jgi:type IV pilus biogenesis protein CpaD/CtpE